MKAFFIAFFQKRGLLILAFFILTIVIMKTLFGSIVTEGSGKLNGNVITKNHYGSFIKQNHTPINPGSPRQITVRSNFNTVVKAWETLSDSNRFQWNNRVYDFPYSDKLGETRLLSGYGLFVKLNMIRINLSLSLLTVPPLKNEFPIWSFIDCQAFSYSNKVFIFASPSLPAGFRLQVFASPQVSASINYMHWDYRFINSIEYGQSFPFELSSTYAAVFPASLITGNVIFVKIRIIDTVTGLCSHFSIKRIVIQNGLSASLGLNWVNTYSGVTTGAMYDVLAYDSNRILASSGSPAGLFVSTDGGSVFARIYTGIASSSCQWLARMKSGNVIGQIFIANKFVRSTDLGLTYSDRATFISADSPYIMAVSEDNRLFFGGVTSGKLFVSSDECATYTQVSIPFPGKGIYRLFIDSHQRLWACSSTGGLLARSSDFGLTWKYFTLPVAYTAVRCFCDLGNGCFLISGTGNNNLLRTTDDGLNWVSVKSFTGSDYVTAISQSLNGVVLLCTWNVAKIHRSTDFGLNWSLLGNPIYGQSYYNFSWSPSGVLFASTYNSGQIVHSNP